MVPRDEKRRILRASGWRRSDRARIGELWHDPEDPGALGIRLDSAWRKHRRRLTTRGHGMFDNGEHNYRSDLRLGERYRDRATGVEGALTSLHFYEHACERGTLRYVNGQGEVIEATFDAPELVHVETGMPVASARPGGPARAEGRR